MISIASKIVGFVEGSIYKSLIIQYWYVKDQHDS